MRLRNLFMPMLVGLAFVGCSNEEDVNPGNDTNGEPKYLNVSINATGALTRADVEGDYEEGTSTENAVSSVRFYFLDENEGVANVKPDNQAQGGWVNYYDVDKLDENGKDMENVEKILKATLVIQTKDGDKLPSSIVAVLNPTDAIKNKGSMGLTELNEIIEDFSGTTTSFLMSNSVYADNSTKMEAVSVDTHLYTTAAAAEADPAIIYVERVLAKTRLTVGLTGTTTAGGETIYKTTKTGATETEKFDNKEIYVKFLGWNVTATAKTSRLMKEINSAWKADLFSNTLNWNIKDLHRSFWAVNPTSMDYTYGPFNTEDDATAANALTSFADNEAKPNYTYLQENASDNKETGANPTEPSQVIIAAQLVDNTGSPMEFAEYAGVRYSIENLKTKYAELAGLWKVNVAGNGRIQINKDDIVLFTDADDHDNNTQPTTENRYKVYAKIKEGTICYASENVTDTTPVNADQILKSLGSSKVWKDGYTYYYFDIRHLNGDAASETAIGKYGVVRNHIYEAKINSLAGLGTPVFDPEEVIYPEKPGNDETYIAAEIRILSWRVVNQGVDLEW